MTEPPSTHSSSDSPQVLILPPLLYGVALAAGFLMQWLAPLPIVFSNARYWAGGIILASGVLLVIWGRRVMEQAGTNVNPTLPTTWTMHESRSTSPGVCTSPFAMRSSTTPASTMSEVATWSSCTA